MVFIHADFRSDGGSSAFAVAGEHHGFAESLAAQCAQHIPCFGAQWIGNADHRSQRSADGEVQVTVLFRQCFK